MKRADLTAARERTIADVLPGPDDPPLRVLFCGINPGLVSAATGHHFARPGNRFWPALHGAGFTPRRLRPDEQHLLPALGLGITNIVPRATARADELSTAELVAGGERLRDLVRTLRPVVRGSIARGPIALGVVGITAYRVAFAAPRAVVGPQPAVGTTLVWALPNPSGLNAHWSLAAMVAEFARFRLAAAAPSRDA
ncbi:MAG: mismatch-specific DNA-glycosylase [Actinomycetota bacterium]|nr:mismatch-specific DNA-glycosylase [Actinomycetota bacterium]